MQQQRSGKLPQLQQHHNRVATALHSNAVDDREEFRRVQQLSPIPSDPGAGGHDYSAIDSSSTPTAAVTPPQKVTVEQPMSAVASTPGIAAAAILKFRFTSSSPNQSAKQNSTTRTVAYPSDSDRLERMRRALEGAGGLQRHRFHTAHQLLFDATLDVPTPELTVEEASLLRLGQKAPQSQSPS